MPEKRVLRKNSNFHKVQANDKEEMSKLYHDKSSYHQQSVVYNTALIIEVFAFFIGAARDIIIIKDLSKQISSSILETEYTYKTESKDINLDSYVDRNRMDLIMLLGLL
jgi:hypothetical protein